METLSQADEARLHKAVKQAVALVDNDNMTPNDALEKVAIDHKLSRGEIHSVGWAYNNGRQAHQRGAHTNILDKLAHFPLTDPQTVADKVFAEKKAADTVDPDYARGPEWLKVREKVAAALPYPVEKAPAYDRDRTVDQTRAYGAIDREKRAVEDLKHRAISARNELTTKIAGLVAYFKQAAHDRYSFDAVEHAANTYIGEGVKPLMDLLHNRIFAKSAEKRGGFTVGRGGAVEKRAADTKMPNISVDTRLEPFVSIRRCIELAGEVKRAEDVATKAAAALPGFIEGVTRPFAHAPISLPPKRSEPKTASAVLNVFSHRQKSAFSWPTEVAAIAAGDIIGQKVDRATEHKEDDGAEELDDPMQDRELSNIRKTSALDSLLSDPRSPLHQYPKEALVQAYNGISKLSPKIAEAPELVQPLLEAHFKKGGMLGKVAMLMEKYAILGTPAVGAAVGTMLSRGIGSVPKTKEDLIEDAWLDLEDPRHKNELRKIQSHAMLNSMMTDPNDPISSHSPDEVIRAYNELSQLAPRGAEMSAVVRPLLRRKLEGHVQPFEVKEVSDIEKSLKETRQLTPDTHTLSKAPDKLQG